jgi:hypothetical protein
MSTRAPSYLEQAIIAWNLFGRQHLPALRDQFPDVDEATLKDDLMLELGLGDLVSQAGISPEEFEKWLESCHDLDACHNPGPPPALAAFLDATNFAVRSPQGAADAVSLRRPNTSSSQWFPYVNRRGLDQE